MLSKDEFLKKIEENVFPLIDMEKEKKVKRIAKISSVCVFVVALICAIVFVALNPPKVAEDYKNATLLIIMFPIILTVIVFDSILNRYMRSVKKKLRPIVLKILNAVHIPEKQLSGLSIDQLRKIHFLPRFDSRRKDKIEHDSFGMNDESLPFYIQEVLFSTGGKHPKFFQGPVIRFFLPEKSDFALMVVKKDSLLSKDEFSLGAKQSLNSLFGKDDWQPLILDSVSFNKDYFAFTNDQIKARRLLTPVFMEHIKDVEKVYQAPTNFLFYEDQLILFVKTNKNMFEFFKFGKNISSYKKFYDEIEVLHQFKDIFKLK
jgi:hypothetical protein